MRALGIDGGAGRSLDPRGIRRVVAVGMGDQDMRHGLAPHRIEQRRRMGFVVGAGIDDRDLAAADDITHRAGEGERARIIAEDPPHARTDFFGHAGFSGEIAVERDVVVVGHGGARFRLVSCHPRMSALALTREARALASLEGWRAPSPRHPSRRARKCAHLRMTYARPHENAWMPVMARPRIKAWTSWVPS